VRFAVLGAVRAEREGQSLVLPPRERLVLAALLLRAGEVVSVAALTAVIWDDVPPPGAKNTLQGHIRRLRQALGRADERIVTRFPGYLIEAGPGELDLADFTRLREEASDAAAAGSWERAASLLRQALALWDGDPLGNVASGYLSRTEVPRLTELRDEATSALIDADLHLGRHGAVTAKLRALVARDPFRERLWEQLMLALYRDGRQRDALGAYGDARHTLRTELGIDPGPRLRALHAQILRADPALDLRPAVSHGRPSGRRPVGRSRGGFLLADSASPGCDLTHGPCEPFDDHPGSTPQRGESVQMIRFLVRAYEAAGIDGRGLASDVGVPASALRGDEAMISPHFTLRLWERGEHALDDPHLPLTIASRFQQGELDLYDYLFTTAPTLRDGLDLSSRYLHLLTTNAELRVEAETHHEVTYSYRYLDADGRGADLALQFSIAIFCARARAGTGQPVTPTRLAFTQPAPRSHRRSTEAFGTSRVDFDAPLATFTFRTRDLDLPMASADPVLARILTRYADTLSPSPSAPQEQGFPLLPNPRTLAPGACEPRLWAACSESRNRQASWVRLTDHLIT
jgi:DNA-binding SARP family transcriptional activator